MYVSKFVGAFESDAGGSGGRGRRVSMVQGWEVQFFMRCLSIGTIKSWCWDETYTHTHARDIAGRSYFDFNFKSIVTLFALLLWYFTFYLFTLELSIHRTRFVDNC